MRYITRLNLSGIGSEPARLYSIPMGGGYNDAPGYVHKPQNTAEPASVLCQLARAEVSYLESYTTQLRTNPTFVQALVRSAAEIRPELIPDKNGETVANLQQMLANAEYLSKEVRYIFHNSLLELGQWSLVTRYLDDIVKLEESGGYKKTEIDRENLLNNARFIVEQAMEIIAGRINRSSRKLEALERLFVRICDHKEKWTGATAEPVHNNEADDLLLSKSFNGALYCLALLVGEKVKPHHVESFIESFNRATPKELDTLGIYLLENITKLRAVFDFYKRLGFRDPRAYFSVHKGTENLADNGALSEKLLREAAIERHVKNIAALGTEAVLRKIWAEIDSLTLKREHTTLEKLIGYEKLPARWFIAPHIPRPPRLEPSRKTSADVRTPYTPLSLKTPPGEHEPVKLAPVLYGGISRTSDTADEPSLRKEKVKTSGVAAPPPTLSVPASNDQIEEDVPSKPILCVKKFQYDLLEKLYKPNVKGLVRQRDFIELFTSSNIGFSLEQGNGSRCTLYPPPGKFISRQPFHMHIIHGRKDELDARCEHDYATRLTTDYGLTLDNFVVA
ncbi:hypothetical protein D9613_009014 [Agrocybe pediades]|uniref:Uncharacterized protein n=1 Tax=Agrocybe pediades TaxID=84607 RepID=A0A8H4R5S5_9AGAR|nr:hypothetical protein D9613_009014 [Agrocybe pediades]